MAFGGLTLRLQLCVFEVIQYDTMAFDRLSAYKLDSLTKLTYPKPNVLTFGQYIKGSPKKFNFLFTGSSER